MSLCLDTNACERTVRIILFYSLPFISFAIICYHLVNGKSFVPPRYNSYESMSTLSPSSLTSRCHFSTLLASIGPSDSSTRKQLATKDGPMSPAARTILPQRNLFPLLSASSSSSTSHSSFALKQKKQELQQQPEQIRVVRYLIKST